MTTARDAKEWSFKAYQNDVDFARIAREARDEGGILAVVTVKIAGKATAVLLADGRQLPRALGRYDLSPATTADNLRPPRVWNARVTPNCDGDLSAWPAGWGVVDYGDPVRIRNLGETIDRAIKRARAEQARVEVGVF